MFYSNATSSDFVPVYLGENTVDFDFNGLATHRSDINISVSPYNLSTESNNYWGTCKKYELPLEKDGMFVFSDVYSADFDSTTGLLTVTYAVELDKKVVSKKIAETEHILSQAVESRGIKISGEDIKTLAKELVFKMK